jgi:hypothetical protein
MSTLLFFIRGGPIQDTRHHFSRGPRGIMHIKKLWAHAYYTTTFTRWAHVGFAESLSLFAHGFYRLYRNLCTALCEDKAQKILETTVRNVTLNWSHGLTLQK